LALQGGGEVWWIWCTRRTKTTTVPPPDRRRATIADVADPVNPPGVRLGAAPAIRVANKALIIRDDHLLVTVNEADGTSFFMCPGGGQEHGEDSVAGLRRECREEIGCDVVVGDFAFLRDYVAGDHEFAALDGWFHQREAFFFCTLAAGEEPGLATVPDAWQTGVTWLPLADLTDQPLWPKVVARWLAMPPGVRPGYVGNTN
jgi:8-oxo-dGTP diphosphatase